MSILDKHKILETNATLLLIFSFLVVTIGGIVQIRRCLGHDAGRGLGFRERNHVTD